MKLSDGTEYSLVNIKKDMLNFYQSQIYEDVYRYYNQPNIFDILSKARDELSHSKFIAWLLNPNETHRLGHYPINRFYQFLAILNIGEGKSEEINNILDNSVISNNYIQSEVEVYTEFQIPGKKRIDIFVLVTIDNKIQPIIIENKVSSKEHDEQTEYYHEWGTKTYIDRKKYHEPIFLFLSPKNQKIKCKSFHQIKYQDLIDNFVEPCANKASDNKTKTYIYDYLRCLNCTDITEIGEGRKMGIAITTEERELLEKFYQNNKKLINAVLLMNTEDMDDKSSKALDSVLETAMSKDYSKYVFEGTEYKKAKLVPAVISYIYAEETTSVKQINTDFPKEIHGKQIMAKCESELSKDEKEKRYTETSLVDKPTNEKIWINNQWGITNISQFIFKAQEKGCDIRKI